MPFFTKKNCNDVEVNENPLNRDFLLSLGYEPKKARGPKPKEAVEKEQGEQE